MLSLIHQFLRPGVATALARRGAAAERAATDLPGWEDRFECVFVWGIWLLMTAAGVAFILSFGSPIPYVDDWAVVAHLADGAPPSLGWLWTQHNEHRYPLSRLVMWASWTLTGGDLRAGMLCAFLPLSIAALALTVAIRQARGWMEYTDAFFPLILLHLGNAQNFLWFIQSFFIWPACLYGLILCAFLNPRWLRHSWMIAGVGVCLLLLPLQGAMGAAYVPALAIAFAAMAVAQWRDHRASRRHALLLLVFAGLAFLLLGAYFWNFHSVAHHQTPDRSLGRVAASTAQFLSMGLGPLASRLGTSSALFVGGALAATFALLGRAYFSQREERVRIAMLVLMLGGPVALALGISWGREETRAPRYIILAVPFWCWLYAVWAVYGRNRVGQFVRMCLFAGMCALSLYHVSYGLELAKARQKLTQAFQKDVAEGVPVKGLAQWAHYWCWDEKPFAEALESLRSHRVGWFGTIAPEPPMKEVALDLSPASSPNVRREGDAWSGSGSDSRLQFSLDKPRFVYAVRLKYKLAAPTDPAPMAISWLRGKQTDPRTQVQSREFAIKLKNGPPLKTQTVWINDVIRDVAITPSNEPYRFVLAEIVLLTADDS